MEDYFFCIFMTWRVHKKTVKKSEKNIIEDVQNVKGILYLNVMQNLVRQQTFIFDLQEDCQ